MSKATIPSKNNRQSGFTLIELSMSLLFIAFIILFLTSTMLNIMHTYNKGIWLNQINAAGRQISSDIGDQIRFSKNAVKISAAEQRFCIGGVTYIWNTVNSFKNRYSEEPANSISNKTTKLRFARVLDGTGKYCYDGAMPSRSDINTSVLLGPGAIIQQFKVIDSPITGLLRVQAVFSTEGDDQPQLNPSTNRYQCGEVINGVFKVGKNQWCAFAEFDIITYRRIAE